MLSTVLRSEHTSVVVVEIMRTFLRLREALGSNRELAAKLDQLEKKLVSHDQAIVGILEAIRQLMQPPQGSSRPIGFVTPRENKDRPAGRSTKASQAPWRHA